MHLLQAYDKDSTGINNKITYNLTVGKSYFTVDHDGSLSATQSLKMETTQDGKFDIIIGAYNMDPCSGSGQSTYLQNVTVVLQVCIENNSFEYFWAVFSFIFVQQKGVGRRLEANNLSDVYTISRKVYQCQMTLKELQY